MASLIRDGQRVVYSALGSGPDVVLLVHNLMAQRGSFAEVATRLAPRCRVLAVDLRGHGESGAAPRAFSVHDLAEDLAAVLDAAAAERALIVGTSIGATAALLLARAQPQRIRGLVLMSATPYAASLKDRARFNAFAAVVRALGPRPLMSSILEPLLGANYRAREPEGVAAAAAKISAMSRRDLAWAVRAWVGRPALIEELAGIQVPVRVVVGDEDTACPARFGEALAAGLPDATLQVIAGAGHSVQLERPAEVASLIEEFLSRLPA